MPDVQQPANFDLHCGAMHSDAGVCSCGWPGGNLDVECLRSMAALNTLRALGYEWRGGDRWVRVVEGGT